MTTGIRGYPITLEETYPSTPTDPVVHIIDPTDTEVATGTPTPIVEGSLDYVFTWNVPDGAVPGVYLIQWETEAGEVSGAEGFTIVPDTLTAAQWGYLRAHVGNAVPPTDAQLAIALTRLGSVEAVALEVLEGRRAALLGGPTEVRIDGDVSWKVSDTALKSLNASIDSLRGATGSGTGLLYRTDRAR